MNSFPLGLVSVLLDTQNAKIDHMQKLERGMDHIVWYPYGSFYIDILGLVWDKLFGLMMIRTNEPLKELGQKMNRIQKQVTLKSTSQIRMH